MIIDEIVLSGKDAYLIDSNGTWSLKPGQTGKSITVRQGEEVEVTAIDLYLSTKDVLSIFARQNKPLFQINLSKEMFPDLYLDPYKHRVHQLSGFEDFNRGRTQNMTPMEVDGIPTLVSVMPSDVSDAEVCSWISAKYPIPPSVTSSKRFDAIAWNLATSRLTSEDSFTYDLTLHYWIEGNETLDDSSRQSLTLTENPHRPFTLRHKRLEDVPNIVGYQIMFDATVNYDSQLIEHHGDMLKNTSLGTPLLQVVYLLEVTEPTYEITSLQELVAHSSSYQLLEPALPLKTITARLHLHAILTEGEYIEISIINEEIEFLEARLDATINTRPIKPTT